jgi:Ser/Thr protein kinase RdoA (MazF antagonist)
MHRENVVLTEADQLFFLDFDACGYGWRVMDIGTYYVSYDWMGLDEESRAQRRAVRAHFLEGYNSVRPLTEAEYETLDLFMAIRHFELLGIGIYRVPFSGAHWVTREQLHATVAWFRAWLRGSDGFNPDLSSGNPPG